jgi:copper chaperone CopZ
VCAHAVRVSLKAVNGVEEVRVNLEKGRATVKMKPGNAVTFKQLQEAITRNGFTMKDSKASIAGKIAVANGNVELRVSGSNDILRLAPEAQDLAAALDGKMVVVEGTVPEAAKGKVADTMRYSSIAEEK